MARPYSDGKWTAADQVAAEAESRAIKASIKKARLERAVKMYLDGVSQLEIPRATGVGIASIRKELARLNIPDTRKGHRTT